MFVYIGYKAAGSGMVESLVTVRRRQVVRTEGQVGIQTVMKRGIITLAPSYRVISDNCLSWKDFW